MPRTDFLALTAALAIGAASAALAASEKAVCAVEPAIACPPCEECQHTPPGAVDLPSLMKIDRLARSIFSRRDGGEERVSAIASDSGDDNTHVPQGVDHGDPWNIRIEFEPGRFTLTMARSDAGYVAFGLYCSAILD